MTCASGLFGATSDGNVPEVIESSDAVEMRSVFGVGSCVCALALCGAQMSIAANARSAVTKANFIGSFIFIFKAGCFSTVTYSFGHFDQLLSKAFNRGRTFDWRSRPELNWDKRFRKPLLYPFELREPIVENKQFECNASTPENWRINHFVQFLNYANDFGLKTLLQF
jgi:hypothetical protein